MYTLDTNVIIYYLKGDAAVVSFFDSLLGKDISFYASTITELELLSFSTLAPSEQNLIKELLATISIIPVDSQIARLAAAVRRISHAKIPDSIIAATALFTGSTLLTRNIKDFKNIPSLSVRKV